MCSFLSFQYVLKFFLKHELTLKIEQTVCNICIIKYFYFMLPIKYRIVQNRIISKSLPNFGIPLKNCEITLTAQ